MWEEVTFPAGRLSGVINDLRDLAHEFSPGRHWMSITGIAAKQAESDFPITVCALCENSYSGDHRANVELQVIGNNLKVVIRNTGSNILNGEIDNIFQPFYRSAAFSDIQGFGLGLPVAQRIIKIHRGEISVSPGVDITIFEIVLLIGRS